MCSLTAKFAFHTVKCLCNCRMSTIKMLSLIFMKFANSSQSSLQRRLAAISKLHKNKGEHFDRRHPAITKTLDGMKRKLSSERTHQIVEVRKDPLVIEDIRGMIE